MRMMRLGLLAVLLAVLALAVAPRSGKSGTDPAWQMKGDYVEACSCHLFCPCYFNKHAEHPSCEFNIAVTVREGHSGQTNLAGAKYWLTGDLGEKWGTERKAPWVVVTFDPSTAKAQRDALAPMILKIYGLDWADLKVQEGSIDISRTGDIVEARLDGGKMAYMKLRREPGADGKGVVLKNVKYFDASTNDGFEMYKSIEHRSSLPGHAFSYSDRNAFLITVTVHEPARSADGQTATANKAGR